MAHLLALLDQRKPRRDPSVNFHPSFLKKFGLLSSLSEHNGCVNRLAWNDDGTLLASCSDDLQVCCWDIETGDLRCSFTTSHTNNIFGLRFLPQSDSKVLVTGAMDGMVEHHVLSDDYSTRRHSDKLFCHRSSVKYIETQLLEPNVFFSTGEDGCVRQYDKRLPNFGCTPPTAHAFQQIGRDYESPNCLVSNDSMVKIFSMRINPMDPNYFVLASSDVHIDIYDRRKLQPTVPRSANNAKPVQSFAPGHLVNSYRAYGTYAEFSPCGRSILATYHTDHTYIFDLFNSRGEAQEALYEPPQMPWRVVASSTPAAGIKSAKENLHLGTKMLDLGMLNIGHGLISRAEEFAAQAVDRDEAIDQLAARMLAVSAQTSHVDMSGVEALRMKTVIKPEIGDIFAVGSDCKRRGKIRFGNAVETAADSSVEDTARDNIKSGIASNTSSKYSSLSTKPTAPSSSRQFHAKTLSNRANVYMNRRYQGDDDAGLIDIDRALQLQPHKFKSMLKRAGFLLRLNRPDEALQELVDVDAVIRGKKIRDSKSIHEIIDFLRVTGRQQLQSRQRNEAQYRARLQTRGLSMFDPSGYGSSLMHTFSEKRSSATGSGTTEVESEQSESGHLATFRSHSSNSYYQSDFYSTRSSAPAPAIEENGYNFNFSMDVAASKSTEIECAGIANADGLSTDDTSLIGVSSRPLLHSARDGVNVMSAKSIGNKRRSSHSEKSFSQERLSSSARCNSEGRLTAAVEGKALSGSHALNAVEDVADHDVSDEGGASKLLNIVGSYLNALEGGCSLEIPNTHDGNDSLHKMCQEIFLSNLDESSDTSDASTGSGSENHKSEASSGPSASLSGLTASTSSSTERLGPVLAPTSAWANHLHEAVLLHAADEMPIPSPTEGFDQDSFAEGTLLSTSTDERRKGKDRTGTFFGTKYAQRFVGAANVATDIKEAIFIGANGEYVASGSDDGHLFIWDRRTAEVLVCRLADADVINCVKAHPVLPIIATSGFEDIVRVWGPRRLQGHLGGDPDALRSFSKKLLSPAERQQLSNEVMQDDLDYDGDSLYGNEETSSSSSSDEDGHGGSSSSSPDQMDTGTSGSGSGNGSDGSGDAVAPSRKKDSSSKRLQKKTVSSSYVTMKDRDGSVYTEDIAAHLAGRKLQEKEDEAASMQISGGRGFQIIHDREGAAYMEDIGAHLASRKLKEREIEDAKKKNGGHFNHRGTSRDSNSTHSSSSLSGGSGMDRKSSNSTASKESGGSSTAKGSSGSSGGGGSSDGAPGDISSGSGSGSSAWGSGKTSQNADSIESERMMGRNTSSTLMTHSHGSEESIECDSNDWGSSGSGSDKALHCEHDDGDGDADAGTSTSDEGTGSGSGGETSSDSNAHVCGKDSGGLKVGGGSGVTSRQRDESSGDVDGGSNGVSEGSSSSEQEHEQTAERCREQPLSFHNRRRLMGSLEGQPMSADEHVILEKIIRDNQNLMHYGSAPGPGSSYPALDNVSWRHDDDDYTGYGEAQNCHQS